MALTSGHREDRRRAYLEGVWRERHQEREEADLMQVEGSPRAGRRQIRGGGALGAGDPGQPGEPIH